VKTGLTVIAYITAKVGDEDKVRDALLDLVVETRKERGCINYDLHQSEKNPNEFLMHENWAAASDLDAHAKTVHIQEFVRAAGGLLERPAIITKWTMISDLEQTH